MVYRRPNTRVCEWYRRPNRPCVWVLAGKDVGREDGELWIRKGITTGFLEQEPPFDPHLKVGGPGRVRELKIGPFTHGAWRLEGVWFQTKTVIHTRVIKSLVSFKRAALQMSVTTCAVTPVQSHSYARLIGPVTFVRTSDWSNHVRTHV